MMAKLMLIPRNATARVQPRSGAAIATNRLPATKIKTVSKKK